ncbi:helix-turn-helix domain-containing protein [Salinicoccus bachuensis]|uniref:Helix-turn-helix domain-containing protein n=1 Tax=Salinicoccus bachuensis TaxID=3136731 RepID=A0ABZ3CJI1_9STAP
MKTVEMGGVFDEGYGIIPKKVMKDTELSIEAKAIYSLLSTYVAGESDDSSVATICCSLNISERRYYRHRKQLIDKGYMTVKKEGRL